MLRVSRWRVCKRGLFFLWSMGRPWQNSYRWLTVPGKRWCVPFEEPSALEKLMIGRFEYHLPRNKYKTPALNHLSKGSCGEYASRMKERKSEGKMAQCCLFGYTRLTAVLRHISNKHSYNPHKTLYSTWRLRLAELDVGGSSSFPSATISSSTVSASGTAGAPSTRTAGAGRTST